MVPKVPGHLKTFYIWGPKIYIPESVFYLMLLIKT